MDELEHFTGPLAHFDQEILKGTKREGMEEPPVKELPKVQAKWDYLIQIQDHRVLWREAE